VYGVSGVIGLRTQAKARPATAGKLSSAERKRVFLRPYVAAKSRDPQVSTCGGCSWHSY